MNCGLPHIANVVTTDCSKQFSGQPGIHVFLQHESDKVDGDLHDIVTLVKAALLRHHSVACCEIVIFKNGAFSAFQKDDGKIQRFILRDTHIQGKLQNQVLHTLSFSDEAPEVTDGALFCESCFKQDVVPLDWKTIDIIQEWQIGVPLVHQVYLESFINSRSLTRTKDIQKFVQEKLYKLYRNFSGLINVSNKKYLGVLQDLHTKELAMKYHSVSTLFQITNASGATQCLKTAERQLKQEADSDLCYFRTYLKKYPLQYTTITGTVTQPVSLRDCYLVVGLDNLVRLTFHHDPVPGQSRSSQLCTLPITVSGVPTDAAITESWHSYDCNGREECSCMDSVKLTKEDFNQVMFDQEGVVSEFMRLHVGTEIKLEHIKLR